MPLQLHAYVWPFVIIWPIFLRYYLSEDLYNKHIGGQEWTFVWCGTIITLQSLVWLSTNWNINLKALFTSKSVKSVQDAQLIKLMPVVNAGSSDICKIERDNVRSLSRPQRSTRLLTFPGWGQNQCLLPLSKTTISLRPGQELFRTFDISPRCRTKALHTRIS